MLRVQHNVEQVYHLLAEWALSFYHSYKHGIYKHGYWQLLCIKKYVNISILILSIIFIGAVYKAQDFQLDASSDTLILENDQDLKNFREVSKEYSSKDFLLITVTSKTRIINQENILVLVILHL